MIPGNLGILLGYAVYRVDHQQRHVAAADGGNGAQHAVALQGLILHRAFAADAGGIDDVVAAAVLAFKVRVDGVARGAGNIADHHALLAKQAVGQAAFAHIGATHQRQLDFVQAVFVLFLILALGGQKLDDFIQQIAQTQHVGGGNAHRLTQTQGVVFVQYVVQARRNPACLPPG